METDFRSLVEEVSTTFQVPSLPVLPGSRLQSVPKPPFLSLAVRGPCVYLRARIRLGLDAESAQRRAHPPPLPFQRTWTPVKRVPIDGAAPESRWSPAGARWSRQGLGEGGGEAVEEGRRGLRSFKRRCGAAPRAVRQDLPRDPQHGPLQGACVSDRASCVCVFCACVSDGAAIHECAYA